MGKEAEEVGVGKASLRGKSVVFEQWLKLEGLKSSVS